MVCASNITDPNFLRPETSPVGQSIGIALCAIGVPFAVLSFGLFFLRRNHSPVSEHPLRVAFAQFLGLLCSYVATGPFELALTTSKYPCTLFLFGQLVWIPLNQGSFLSHCVVVYYKLKLQSEMRTLKTFTPEGQLTKQLLDDITKERQHIRGIKWRTSDRAVFALHSVIAIPIIAVFISYIPSLENYAPGCVGCGGQPTDREVLIGLGAVMLLISFGLLIGAYNLDVLDASGVMHELRASTSVWVFMIAVYLPFNLLDVGAAEAEGHFRWYIIICIAATLSYSITVLRPALKTFSWWTRRSEEDLGELELEDVLNTTDGQELFEKHVLKEFSVENFRFYMDAKKWRDEFSDPAVDSKSLDGVIQRHARWIFDTYISSRAILVVNLSSATRNGLNEAFNTSEQNPVEGTVFDNAISEVYRLMELDTFHRFMSSTSGRKLVTTMGLTQPYSGRKSHYHKSKRNNMV